MNNLKKLFSERLFSLILFLSLVFILLFLNPCVQIDAGHRGVILNLGAVSETILEEGLHFRIPFVQSIKSIDVRILKKETKAQAASKDLQNISTLIALNYHLNPQRVNELYKNVGLDYEDKVIDPAVQEIVKSITAKYTAAELITLREDVSMGIKSGLDTRLQKYYLVIDDFSIKDFEFSQTFAKAIEAKQEAEQLALKAERDLQRVKIEAEQQIATARAEAERLRLKNISVSPLMIQLNAIDKWDGKLPQYMMGNTVPFINLNTK